MKKILLGILLGVGVVLSGYSVSKSENHFQFLYQHGTIGSYEIYTIKLQDNTNCVVYRRHSLQCDFSERIK